MSTYYTDGENIIFDSAGIYMESATDLKDKLAKICQLIDALYTQALNMTGTAGIDEYMLNDGQTIIKQSYKSSEDIMKTIKILEQQKNSIFRQLNGTGTVRLVDSKSFRMYRRW